MSDPNTNRPAGAAYRLGVDIGGTFTDLVIEADGFRHTAKVLTTSAAPERAVLQGIDELLSATKLGPSEISAIIHGTTLATNALIERRGARTALITSEGFRDVLEIGTETRFDHYDLDIDKPLPLVPRQLRLGIKERVSANGDVLIPLDRHALKQLPQRLESLGIESVAVGFLHSFVRPDHEFEVREVLTRQLPGVSVSLSCEVSPEIREYERFSTTVMNAYLQPKVSGYLRTLDEKLRLNGFACPVYLMLSNGGLTDLATAMRFPVRLVESGPAGGVILARHIALECGLSRILSFDMGGTTAKICLFDDATPATARNFEVARAYRFKRGSGLPLRIPVIEMVEIGAGGGSLARVHGTGLIAVGPESAASEPGPACYGRGGRGATVTDANLVLGRIAPLAFAGGNIKLDVNAAESAIERDVATPLAVELPAAALGIVEMVDENMANAAREHAAERGMDIAGGRTMIAFGGSAPLHAARLAEKLGIEQIVIPVDAGVASAVGFLRAPISYEIIRTSPYRLDTLDVDAIDTLLEKIADEARGFVARGAPGAQLSVRRRAFMRYLGQRHDILVPLPSASFAAIRPGELREAFEMAYERQFARTLPQLEVEVISWSVVVATQETETRPIQLVEEAPFAGPTATKTLLDPGTGDRLEAKVIHRGDLEPGATLDGPAVVIENDTSTVVPRGFRLTVNGNRYLILKRSKSE